SAFVLGNALTQHFPIVYCSDGFLVLTRYPRASVMSRSSMCHFLWGPTTSAKDRATIMHTFCQQTELTMELTLYKRTGEPFRCELNITPIKNERGFVVLFLCVYKHLPSPKLPMSCSVLPLMHSFTRLDTLNTMAPSSRLLDGSCTFQCQMDSGRFNLHRGPCWNKMRQINIEPVQGPVTAYESDPGMSCCSSEAQSNSTRENLEVKGSQSSHKCIDHGKNVPEYKMQQFTKPNSVLLHYGLFRIVWDWILLLFTFYIAFMVPYNVTFGRLDGRIDVRKQVVDLIVEVLMVVDVILNFNTTYVNKNGQLVYNRRQLAKHYLRGWFLLDGLAALPVDFLLFTLDWSISLLQMMKLARLLRLARLCENFSRLSQHSLVVLGLLMFIFTLVAHWFACIWHVVGVNEGSSEAGWIGELARRLNTSDQLDDKTKYFTALYFTCSSLTSVGFGNVSANTVGEKIFAICIMLLGALMHAAVFGNVTAIIQRIYARRTAFQSRTQDLKDFVRVHRIPKPLKHRMEDFFQTMWAINRGIDTNEILSMYPEELRRDICLQLNREILSLKVFKNASQDCLKSLAMQIKTTFFTPGEHLIHSGDVLRRLYFVCSGSLEILDNGEVVALLGKNDWFGTYINTTTHPGETIRSRCDVKSLTYCDLQCIDLTSLNQVLDQYPKFKSEFIAYLCEDLSFNIQEGAAVAQTKFPMSAEFLLRHQPSVWYWSLKHLDDKSADDSLDSNKSDSLKTMLVKLGTENHVVHDSTVMPAITMRNLDLEEHGCQHPSAFMLGENKDRDLHRSCKSLGELESGGPHTRFDTSYSQADEELSDSSLSSMRYYPRRPLDASQLTTDKRRFQAATFGAIFSAPDVSVRERFKKYLRKSVRLETARNKHLSVRSHHGKSRRHTLPVLKVTMVDRDSDLNQPNPDPSKSTVSPLALSSEIQLCSDSSLTTSDQSWGSHSESYLLLQNKRDARRLSRCFVGQKRISYGLPPDKDREKSQHLFAAVTQCRYSLTEEESG
ncbi:potassium voltage-gated channel subfamily H member 8, partial [Clonorchis sinensis]